MGNKVNNQYIAKRAYGNNGEFFKVGDTITIESSIPYTKLVQGIYRGLNCTTGKFFEFEISIPAFIDKYLDPYIEEDFNPEDPIDDFGDNELPFKTVIDEMYRVYLQKNSDYGNSFDKSLDKFGLISSVVRLNDKFNRIESLVKSNKQMVKDESIRDTFLDLANYAAMTVAWLDNQE